jgi:hypothetical protein
MPIHIAAGLLLIAAPAVNAQIPGAASPPWPTALGQRVQVGLPVLAEKRFGMIDDRHVVRGTVEALSLDTLYLRPHPAAGLLAIPRPAIRSLALSRGHSRSRTAFRWAARGVIVGALGAGLLETPLLDDTRPREASTVLLNGALVGGSLGAWLGAWKPTEDWRALPLPSASVRPR